MDRLKFNECFVDVTGGNAKIKQGDYLSEGRIPIIDQGKELIGGYTDDETQVAKCKLPCIIYGDHSRNVKFYEKPFAIGADGIKLLETTEKLIPKYGYYYLQTVKLPEAGYDRSFKYLKRIDVPVPDIETQNKIVAILDKAKALLDKREKTIALYDKLLRATFLDMFGDPVFNPMGWETVELSSICKKITDGTHKTPKYLDDGIKFISAKNIVNNQISWEDIKYISEAECRSINSRCNPEFEDILLTKSGSLGQPALVDVNFEFSLFESLALIKYDRTKALPVFLISYLMSDGVGYFYRQRHKGVAVKHLHLVDIKSIPIYLPPIDLQKDFEKKYNQYKKMISAVKNFRVRAEELMKSLSQQAFSDRVNIDVDVELEALIDVIDPDKKDEENNVATIKRDLTLLQRLIDKLRERDFKNAKQYDKAVYVAFKIMKEEPNLIKQELDASKKEITVKL